MQSLSASKYLLAVIGICIISLLLAISRLAETMSGFFSVMTLKGLSLTTDAEYLAEKLRSRIRGVLYED